jgi:hypothetical protein
VGRFASPPKGGSREISRQPIGLDRSFARETRQFPASRPDSGEIHLSLARDLQSN